MKSALLPKRHFEPDCCLLCGAPAGESLSFGPMPLANGFLEGTDFASEKLYDLKIICCGSCGTTSLSNPLAKEALFNDHYPYFSSTSARMAAHFRKLAEQVISSHSQRSRMFVVELGSNDGVLLKHCVAAGVRHLGIEPSGSVARVATEQGVSTLQAFFDNSLAQDIVSTHGRADAIIAANVMCHITAIHSALDGIAILLKPAGRFYWEDPYWGDVLARTAYDQVYDEHAFYFTIEAVSRALRLHDLEIIDVEHHEVHGGSMRYVVAHRGAHAISPAVSEQLAQEAREGINTAMALAHFGKRVAKSREQLLDLLWTLKRQGRRVVGYGATSKSTTVINYCAIDCHLIEYISDTTPAKQGKFSPGAHIPIKPHAAFQADDPDTALLFAWNHEAEIREKERDFSSRGGRWILYVPTVQLV